MRWLLHLAIDGLAIGFGFLPIVDKRRALTASWLVIGSVLLIAAAIPAAHALEKDLANPPVWDFRCFWLYGRVADVLHQPYDPHSMHQIAHALSLDRDRGFDREVLDVGFVYPPPTVALYAPLGLFPTPPSAIKLWDPVLLLTVCIDVTLLWLAFMRTEGWRGLACAAMLVALFPTTASTVEIGQSAFIAMAFVMLFLVDRSAYRQGIWLALSAIVKPFLLIIVLYPMLRKDWRSVLAAFATICCVTVAVLPLIGWRSVVRYFTEPPELRLPNWMLTSDSNQSILGWIVRTFHQKVSVSSAIHEPLFLVIALGLSAATAMVIYNYTSRDRSYSVSLLIVLSLLIYPHAQWFYGVLLLIPIGLLWSRRQLIPGTTLLLTAFTVVEFILAATGNAQIFGVLLAWAVLAAAAPAVAGEQFESHTQHASVTS